MGIFHTPPPRRFRLPPIYIDERQERLQQLEQRAKTALEAENSKMVKNGKTMKQSETQQRYELSDRKLINAHSSFGINLWQLCLFLGLLLIVPLVLFFF